MIPKKKATKEVFSPVNNLTSGEVHLYQNYAMYVSIHQKKIRIS